MGLAILATRPTHWRWRYKEQPAVQLSKFQGPWTFLSQKESAGKIKTALSFELANRLTRAGSPACHRVLAPPVANQSGERSSKGTRGTVEQSPLDLP